MAVRRRDVRLYTRTLVLMSRCRLPAFMRLLKKLIIQTAKWSRTLGNSEIIDLATYRIAGEQGYHINNQQSSIDPNKTSKHIRKCPTN